MIKRLPASKLECSFSSCYLVVPKRDGGLRPILQAHQQSDLQASIRDDFAGTDPGADSPRGLVASVDLKDAYFHIQTAQHHMRFLRFALEGTAYQYLVLLFELALFPRTFSKCMDAAPPPPPLRASGMRDLSSVMGHVSQPHIQTASSLMELLRLCGN